MDYAGLRRVQAKLERALLSALEVVRRDGVEPPAVGDQVTLNEALRGVLLALEGRDLHSLSFLIEELLAGADCLRAGNARSAAAVKPVLSRGIDVLKNALACEPPAPAPLGLPVAVIDDLRAVRGKPLLSANLLFSPNLDAQVPAPAQPDADALLDDATRLERLRLLRTHFQRGLVEWLRGSPANKGLAQLESVLKQLVMISVGQRTNACWWTALALVEGIRRDEIAHGVAVTRLLGRIDGELKRVLAEGVQGFSRPVPSALMRSLLFYVESSSRSRGATRQVKLAFGLGDVFDVATLREPARDAAARRVLHTSMRVVADSLSGKEPALSSQEASAALEGVCDGLALLDCPHARKLLALQLEALKQAATDGGDAFGPIAQRLDAIASGFAQGVSPRDEASEDAAQEEPSSGALPPHIANTLHHAKHVLSRLGDRDEPQTGRKDTSALDVDAIRESVQDHLEIEKLGLAPSSEPPIDIEALAKRTEELSQASGGVAQAQMNAPPSNNERDPDHAQMKAFNTAAEQFGVGTTHLERRVVTLQDSLSSMNDTIRKLRDQVYDTDVPASREPVASIDAASQNNSNVPNADVLSEGLSELERLRYGAETLNRETASLLDAQSRESAQLKRSLTRRRGTPVSSLCERWRNGVALISRARGVPVDVEIEGESVWIAESGVALVAREVEQLLAACVEQGIAAHYDASSKEAARLHITCAGAEARLLVQITWRGASVAAAVLEDARAHLAPLEATVRLSGTALKWTLDLNIGNSRGLSRILTVQSRGEVLGVPSDSIARILRLTRSFLDAADDEGKLRIDGTAYMRMKLSSLLGFVDDETATAPGDSCATLLLRGQRMNVALTVDEVREARDSAIVPLGPQFDAIVGLRGAILDGMQKPVLILDLPALVGQYLDDVALAPS